MSNNIEAEYILNSNIFKSFKENYESTLFEQWKITETIEDRELIHTKLLGIDLFMMELTAELMRYNNGN